MNDLFRKQNELYKKQYDLADLKANCDDFKESRRLSKAQDEIYKKYMFFKNLNKAMKEVNKNENK